MDFFSDNLTRFLSYKNEAVSKAHVGKKAM